MDGAVTPDYPDEATAAKVAEISRHEDLTPDQIAEAALKFYVRLPKSARDVWRSIEQQQDHAIDEAAWAAGRALLDWQYDSILDAYRRSGRSPLPPDASEQDIIDFAVKICRRR
jgi:hypothetical protein